MRNQIQRQIELSKNVKGTFTSGVSYAKSGLEISSPDLCWAQTQRNEDMIETDRRKWRVNKSNGEGKRARSPSRSTMQCDVLFVTTEDEGISP